MKSPRTTALLRRATAVTLAALTATAATAPTASAASAASADAAASRTAVTSTAEGARVPAVSGPRGKLLTARPLKGGAALPSAARTWSVTYLSEGATGKRVVVSGTVSVPKTAPPRGGWPVISWAHGTTGTADVCAPSKDDENGPAHAYVSAMRPTLDAWVARGFAVVQTDYEGLGTPGEHPYMNSRSAANTVIDIVRAARGVDRRVGRDWFTVGHSQGGHAALVTAAANDTRKGPRLRGAVSIAPGGWGLSQTVPYFRDNLPAPVDALAFLPTILIGASAAEPAVKPEEILTDEMRPLLAAARTACVAQVREVAAVTPVSQVIRTDADLAPLTAYLRAQEPVGLRVTVPTLVAQGTHDGLVPKQTTDLIVADLCRQTPKVTYRVYDGADHRGAVPRSFDDALAFTKAILAGQTPATTC
ncbi:alpha/beta hydrolase family protein [Nonomuraea cavernae]|uniref:Lipase n=1 Tax=Nonomuraea cavernae TaxID=2045107 RepID=A0A917Z4G1_9ACTN|nr:alpha/beta hydrolase [Nonomuraea cavernae]MCA2188099.1 alpha/beta hydrolase [Nonomuraea cavernae]GGO72779.1 lipase [Nonomuraea cavernae]